MFKECADIQTADTLNLPGIPECEVHNVSVEPTEVQKELVASLSERAEAIHNRTVDPTVDNMLRLTTDKNWLLHCLKEQKLSTTEPLTRPLTICSG